MNTATMLSRRELLKTGLTGSLLLATASLTSTLTGCATAPAVRPADSTRPTYRFLTDDDEAMWLALGPAILAPSMSSNAVQREAQARTLVSRIDITIWNFSPNKQQEVRQLFDLLNLGLMRGLTTGMWSSWKNADPADITEFLDGWRTSRIGLFNQGYVALCQLASAPWHSHPDQWALASYDGPPRWATDALPQFRS